MGRCLKGKDETRAVPGAYRCEKCGAVALEKDHVCKPREIKEEEKESQDRH